MLILGIDLETSGLIDKYQPLDDPCQPHIVEIGAVLVDDADEEIGVWGAIAYPDGWEIGSGATAVHGITTEYARANGIPIKQLLQPLVPLVMRADVIVAHNLNFERQMIMIELMRLKAIGDWWKQRNADMRCTMELSTPILKLPGRYDDYKYPKLSEAHGVLCPDKPFRTTHRSLGDARAAIRVYRAILELEKQHGPSRSPGAAEAGNPADDGRGVHGGEGDRQS